MNALANHNILPHDGKSISKGMAVTALTSAVNLDPSIANALSVGGVYCNPNHQEHTFDLDHLARHGLIEHDASLSRDDIAFGSNAAFSQELWEEVLKIYQEGVQADGTINVKTVSKARYARVQLQKARHAQAGKEFTYGIKETIFSYGEQALFLNLLGTRGVAPLKWVRVLFEEERLPYNEGWRPPSSFNKSNLSKTMAKLVEENEHKSEEAVTVGLGTYEILRSAVVNLSKEAGGHCTIM